MLGTIVIVVMTVLRILLPLAIFFGVGELVRHIKKEKSPLQGA